MSSRISLGYVPKNQRKAVLKFVIIPQNLFRDFVKQYPLCNCYGANLLEAEACPDRIHMLVEI